MFYSFIYHLSFAQRNSFHYMKPDGNCVRKYCVAHNKAFSIFLLHSQITLLHKVFTIHVYFMFHLYVVILEILSGNFVDTKFEKSRLKLKLFSIFDLYETERFNPYLSFLTVYDFLYIY